MTLKMMTAQLQLRVQAAEDKKQISPVITVSLGFFISLVGVAMLTKRGFFSSS